MTADPQLFRRRLARRLAEAGKRKVRRRVERSSRTLAMAMEVRMLPSPRGRAREVASIYIADYWAVYVHDGRKPFKLRRGSYMVWFRNPNLDPRLRGGRTPRRRRNLRRLTRAEFQEALEIRNNWIALTGDPFSAPVIITNQITKPTPPNKFFSNEAGGGMANFRSTIVGRIAPVEMSRHVRAFMGDALSVEESLDIKL